MTENILSLAYQLQQAGQPFIIATVVRAHAPTSAKAGMKAIITPSGQLSGWVGGSCTQPTVIRESLKALQDGSPRFLRLGPPELLRGETPGVIEVPLTCVSGGTLEIYIEPHLPPLQLLAIGHLPVVEALAALAKDMNYRVTVMGENVIAENFSRADRVLPLDFANLPITPQTCVVVASHGNYDEPALEAALNSHAPYVALIASKKRRDSVMEYLRGSGLAEEKLARLKCPAGLDFGAVTPGEIALSILAEIVQLRRRGMLIGSTATSVEGEIRAAVPEPVEAVDPVCHMMVEIADARYVSEYVGQRYYFCSPGCKRSFDKEPEKYLKDRAMN